MKQEYAYLHFPDRVWNGGSSTEITRPEYKERQEADTKAYYYHLKCRRLFEQNDVEMLNKRRHTEAIADLITARHRIIEKRMIAQS